MYGRAPGPRPVCRRRSHPFEAMRLGCEVTAADINPVAWFILKCTLEYPQRFAGKKHPLPQFILNDQEFMEKFYKATRDSGLRPRRSKQQAADLWFSDSGDTGKPSVPDADLAWHVRAWGRWVLKEARKELARFYPTYADFEPLDPSVPYETREPKFVPVDEKGETSATSLNSEFDDGYLANNANPRWVLKPTVAYLWARTVKCKDCRATVPLLKPGGCARRTGSACFTMEPDSDKSGVIFGVQTEVPEGQVTLPTGASGKRMVPGLCQVRRQVPLLRDHHDDGRHQSGGGAGRLGSQMTAVVVDGQRGKEYRLPTADEIRLAAEAEGEPDRVFSEIPLGCQMSRCQARKRWVQAPLMGLPDGQNLY